MNSDQLGVRTTPENLRSVVLHEVAESENPLTGGLGVTLSPGRFTQFLDHVQSRYELVGLRQLIDGGPRHSARAPILLTFDDAYRSVATVAAPILRDRGIPALFFVNASLVAAKRLAFDNLAAFIFNEHGLEQVRSFLREHDPERSGAVDSLASFFFDYAANLGLEEREVLRAALEEQFTVDHDALIATHRPYLDWSELAEVVAGGVEIGNHSNSHVFIRSLDQRGLTTEVRDGKDELEKRLGVSVCSFSVPYGSSRDLTTDLEAELSDTGHSHVFLVEGTMRPFDRDRCVIDRISPKRHGRLGYHLELDVLPRLRLLRRRLRGAG